MKFSDLINFDTMDGLENDIQIETEAIAENGIAIIGISAKFGESKNAHEFWDNLVKEKDCIRTLPEQRRGDYDYYQNALIEHGLLKEKKDYGEYSYLDEIDKFDADFFNISPLEARIMDPNQRLLLESAWETIEDAGYGGGRLVNTKTGVFVGFSTDFNRSYKEHIMLLEPSMLPLAIPGNIHSIIASRIAYLLDLHGPSMVIDTACSSSLVAVHMAANSIKRGECDMAIAGGVKLILNPMKNESTGVGVEIESQTGRTRTFDDDSDGTGSGEGVATVLLKPLSKALKDGDHVYAVIRGSAINQDGNTTGITAPSAKAQEEVILKAWEDAGINPESISYIEAHGTGTKLGDPIEITGITRAFQNFTNKKQFCGIGSVKTNIGHLDHVSGMAGLIKVIMLLNQRQIPASIHLKKPNRKIDFLESPVYVNNILQEWNGKDYPFRCGINSFGLSGTNCHMILEEAPRSDRQQVEEEQRVNFFTLSAKNYEALKRMLYAYREYNNQYPDVSMEDICYTANTGRGHYGIRLAMIIESKAEFITKIKLLCEEHRIENIPQKGIYFSEGFENGNKDQYTKKVLNIEHEILNSDNQEYLWKELGELYCAGADIDWELLYSKQAQKRRVSLPVYSFERKRYWVDATKGNSLLPSRIEKEIDHPLLDRCLIQSLDVDIYGTYFSVEKHWVLNEHKVNGQYVIPGTTYIEMIRWICINYLCYQYFELKNLTFITPFMVESGEIREVQTVLKKCNGYLEVSVISKHSNGKEFMKHAEAKLYQLKQGTERKVDVDELKHRMNKDLTSGIVATKGLVEIGPRWNNCERIFLGDNEALALMNLPEEYKSDCEEYLLHPALMDNAANIAINSMGDGLYLPLSYKSLKVYGSMPSRFYSFVKLNEENVQVSETFSFDVTLMDLNGNVFAEATNYSIKKVRNIEWKPKVDYKAFYHQMKWEALELDRQERSLEAGRIVLMEEDKESARNLAEKLRSLGVDVIEICNGDRYEKVDECTYYVGKEESDYQKIVSEVFDANISKVIFTSLKDTPVSELKGQQMEQLTRLFYLVKTLENTPLEKQIDFILLLYCANAVIGNETIINPHNAALVGLCRVVEQETRKIKCRTIDIDYEISDSVLMDEILGDSQFYQIAYRKDQRYVEVFKEAQGQKDEKKDFSIQKEGAYIITGGFGGLGLEIAKFLAKSGAMHIVLFNRSAVLPRDQWDEILKLQKDVKLCKKIAAIQEMEATGADVLCCQVNVADYEAVNHSVNFIRSKYGKINGIFHCAGVAGEGLLGLKDIQTFQEVVLPKMNGTLYLDLCTASDELDFFVMYSSISAFIGYLGQGDYSAANAYLDAYADYRSQRGKKTLAINWPIWKETGMAHEYGLGEGESIFKPIMSEQGIHILKDILELNMSRVIVGELNYDVLSKVQNNIHMKLSEKLLQRLSGKNHKYEKVQEQQYESRSSGRLEVNIEQKVSEIYAKTLEKESVEEDESFYDMGGDSILATLLIKELEYEFPGIVDISDIFRYQTVRSMAEYISKSVGITEPEQETLPLNHTNNEDELEKVLWQLANGNIDVDQVDSLLK